MKNKRKRLFQTAMGAVIFLLGICFISGCSPQSETQPSETPQATASPQPTDEPDTTPEPSPAPKTEVIGTFTTKILDQQSGRVTNIKIASNVISKKTVESGGTFSFNGVVGRRTPEKGYKKATVLIDGKKGFEYGGGICQVSSTLYNAAKNAGLNVTERHNHTNEVHYIEIGNDAAVAYGSQDLKFVNTKPYPITFQITVNSDMTLTAKVIGVQG